MEANEPSAMSIALTEKKLSMTLDDIIKMSRKASFKGKQAPRTSNKSQRYLNDQGAQRNSKLQRFMNSRSSIRQGVLAQRRTSVKDHQFPMIAKASRMAVVVTTHKRAFHLSKQRFANVLIQRNTGAGNMTGKVQGKKKLNTLDALFSDLKQKRIRTIGHLMARNCGRLVGRRRAGRRKKHRRHKGIERTQARDRF